MKVLVILAAFGAVASAQVVVGGVPQNFNYGYSALAPAYAPHYAAPAVTYAAPAVTYAAPAVVAPAVTKTQYHAQDELGQASYGHAEPGQAHAAFRDANGNVRGSYAYVNPEGQEIRVNYVAGHGGFRAESNALPQAPIAHLASPLPVQDTPEVQAAKAQHFAAVAEVQARGGRRKRGAVAVAAPVSYISQPAYSTYSVAAPQVAYSVVHAPALTYSNVHAPALAYSGVHAPALTYSGVHAPVVAVAAPVAYAAAPVAYAASPVAVAAAQPVREATLTKIVNTPGHAVSYRVD